MASKKSNAQKLAHRTVEGQEIIDRINGMNLMISNQNLRSILLDRVQQIDNEIASVLVFMVEYDQPLEPIHQTGDSAGTTLDYFEARRIRIMDYMNESLKDDGNSDDEDDNGDDS